MHQERLARIIFMFIRRFLLYHCYNKRFNELKQTQESNFIIAVTQGFLVLHLLIETNIPLFKSCHANLNVFSKYLQRNFS